MQGAEVKMYRYTANRGNVALGMTVASATTINFNSWFMQGYCLIPPKKFAPIEKPKNSKMVIG